MKKALKCIIRFIKIFIEGSKLFFTLTGFLAVFVGYNYFTKKPNISIERYDPFVCVKMRGFYDSIRIRDGMKFNRVNRIENIFKELKVPFRDECSPEEDRYIIFPLETKINKNLIQLWNQKAEIYQTNRKHLTETEMQNNRYKAVLSDAGYEKRSYDVSIDSKWYLEEIGNPEMFFDHLNIPVPEIYQKKRDNYYYNVFQYKDNYVEDVFKKALDKIDDISLKTDFLDSFIGNRQLWTPFIIKNVGNATAKDIQIVFQSGNVSGLYKLIETNLNHQGISYFESTETVNSQFYVSNTKNNLLQIPFLKPDEIKIIVIKSSNLMPENEILQIKGYIGEEINRSVIKWSIAIFILILLIYIVILFIEQKGVELIQ